MAPTLQKTMYIICGLVVVLSHITLAAISYNGSTNSELLPLPTVSYKATANEYDAGGMAPFYDLVRGFIDMTMSGDPMDLLNETMSKMADKKNGTDFKIGETAQKVVDQFKGYFVVLGIGLVLIVLIPLLGCVYCGCRICRRGGGKPVSGSRMRRVVLTVLLVCTSAFIIAGLALIFVSNSRISTALDKMVDTTDNLQDVGTYVHLVYDQVIVITEANLNISREKTLAVMETDNMSISLSGYVLNALSKNAMDDMQNNIQRVKNAEQRFNEELDAMNKTYQSMGLQTAHNSNPVDQIKSGMSSFEASMTTFKAVDPVKQVKMLLAVTVRNNLNETLNASRAVMVDGFDDMATSVHDIVDAADDFLNNMKDLNISDLQSEVKSTMETARSYDAYRNLAGIVLAVVVGIIVVLQVFGLVLGLRCGKSTIATSALTGSVALIFTFAAFMMLLSTISFAIGAVMERFICQHVSDQDITLIEFSAKMFLDTEKKLDTTLSEILRECRADKPVYTAFRLQSKFNMSNIDDILGERFQDIDTAMDNSLASLRGMNGSSNLYATTAENSFSNLETAFNSLDFTSMKSTVGRVPFSATGMKAAIDELEEIKLAIPAWKVNFKNGMSRAQDSIGLLLHEEIANFKESVLNPAKMYTTSFKYLVTEEMGKCKPVWNSYQSIFVVAFCQHAVDAFNSFWFSVGWCLLFFLPSTIVSIMLSHHFKKGKEPSSPSNTETPGLGEDAQSHPFSNKVSDVKVIGDEPVPE